MKKRSEKRVSRKDAKGAKVTARGPSSRANARDLRRRFLGLLETRISPGACPELCRRGRNDTERHFAPWRSFGPAQDMLGATNVLEIVLFTIFKVRNHSCCRDYRNIFSSLSNIGLKPRLPPHRLNPR